MVTPTPTSPRLKVALEADDYEVKCQIKKEAGLFLDNPAPTLSHVISLTVPILPVNRHRNVCFYGGNTILNVAVTVLFWFIDTVQTFPLVLSQPTHESNAEPGIEFAVRLTEVPLA